MVINLHCFRAPSLPFAVFSYPTRFLRKPSPRLKTRIVRLFSSTAIITTQSVPYGPSLQKGKNPFGNDLKLTQIDRFSVNLEGKGRDLEESDEKRVLSEDEFARIYEISAIRVPAKDCFALESRLRGHLLNWPRIRNIARVPGDEVEDDVAKLLGHEKEVDVEEEEDDEARVVDSVNRRICGKAERDGERLNPVLYREKLARMFNSTGYVKFRNLAKISRPARRRKQEKTEDKRGKEKARGRSDFASVEVVEEGGGAGEMEGLLGKEYGKRGKWRGSTRLLLLDERYSGKAVEELPESIKVLFVEDETRGWSSSVELVKCNLTLFYDYWPMNKILEALLPKDMVIPSAFETVGHIAHLNLRDEHLPYKMVIAKVVLDKNQPKIQTVVNKIDTIHNDYRTMQLEVLAGNHSLVTMVVENGLRFHVDLAKVYWNSRLATERQRLVFGFKQSDVVCTFAT